MVEEELEELKLSIRENDLLSLVAQNPTIGVEPQTLELPDPLIPEIKAYVIALHLVLDVGDIHVSSLLSHWVELGQLSVDSLQKAKLESNQIVIDAHPVAGVLPVFGLDILAFERTLRWLLWLP
jgi:hypothetical protein